MTNHKKYIDRCIELAKNGLGNTYPNPLVGSVIVYNNKIIGEGFHTKAGEAHAEINAINNVKDKSLLKKSTLYVNLEPCSHWGKTPPCAKQIVDYKIPNVVVGTRDTTKKVSGKGIEILKKAGIEVIENIEKEKCRELNKRFFTFHEKKRPYIILKWAQSADGFIDKQRTANSPIEPNWITGELERILVHKWRVQEQSILVGTNTVRKDNPQLTSRHWFGKNPVRLYIDKKLDLQPNYFLNDNTTKTICFNKIKSNNEKENSIFVKLNDTKSYIRQMLNYLYSIDIQSVIVEGGQILLQSFIDENLWDEALVFTGKQLFISGVKAPKIFSTSQQNIYFKESILTLHKNVKNE